MALENQKVSLDPDCFVPTPGEVTVDKPEHWTGKRKSREAVQLKLWLKWPTEAALKMNLFRTWHEVAMKSIDTSNRPALTVLAVIWRYFNLQSGTAWPTNETMADVAGTSVSTIKRGVNDLSKAGFFETKYGYEQGPDKKLRRRRVIHFTIPETFGKPIFLSNSEPDHMVNSGTSESEGHRLHSERIHQVNSGTDTVEETVEKGQANAA